MTDTLISAVIPIALGSFLTLVVATVTSWQTDRRAARREQLSYERLREDTRRAEARAKLEQIVETLNEALSHPKTPSTEGWQASIDQDQARSIMNAIHWIPDATVRESVSDGITAVQIGSLLNKLHPMEVTIALLAVRGIVAAYNRGDIPSADQLKAIKTAKDRAFRTFTASEDSRTADPHHMDTDKRANDAGGKPA